MGPGGDWTLAPLLPVARVGNGSPNVCRISGMRDDAKTDNTETKKKVLLLVGSIGEKPRDIRVGRIHPPCQASWISFDTRMCTWLLIRPLAWVLVNGHF